MKTISYSLAFGCVIICIISTGIVFVKAAMTDIYTTCFLRVCHAALVRDKIRVCAQKKYKSLLPDIIPQDEIDNNADKDFLWSRITSESYGPQKIIKNEVQRATKKKKKSAIQKQPRVLLTKHVAPFILPLEYGSFWISSRFGPRRRPDGSPDFHYGIDFAASRGTPIYAVCTGRIIYAGWINGYGNTIMIEHDKNIRTRYAHLDRIFVKRGEGVICGARIGSVGATGHIRKKGGDGSHLHFEVHYRGKKIDPLQFLPDVM